MTILAIIRRLLEKHALSFDRYRSKVRIIFFVLTLIFVTFTLYDFYNVYFSWLQFVLIKENLTWENFKLSLPLVDNFIKRLLLNCPTAIHLSFLVAVVLLGSTDLFCAGATIFVYVVMVLSFGVSTEINIILSKEGPCLFSGIWFRIDVVYPDEYMVHYVDKFVGWFNSSFKTDFSVPEDSVLNELLKKSHGSLEVLFELLLDFYNAKKVALEIRKSNAKKRYLWSLFKKIPVTRSFITNVCYGPYYDPYACAKLWAKIVSDLSAKDKKNK